MYLDCPSSRKLAGNVFDPVSTMIYWRHTPPLKKLLCNFFSASINCLSGQATMSNACPRCQFNSLTSSFLDGHLVVSAASALPISLQWLFRLGQHYRPGQLHIDTTEILIEAFSKFADKTSPDGQLSEWLAALHSMILAGRAHVAQSQSSRIATHNFMIDALSTAKLWKRVFAFISADKLKHNFVACCRNAYSAGLANEITLTGTYQLTPHTRSAIFELAEQTNKLWGTSLGLHDDPCLSYLYGTAKLHKPVFRFRFILGVSKKLMSSTPHVHTSPPRYFRRDIKNASGEQIMLIPLGIHRK